MRHTDCCAIATAALLAGDGGLAESPRPADFVGAASMVKPFAVELRYFTPHNVVGTRVDGYEKPVSLLTRRCSTSAGILSPEDFRRG